MSRAGRTIAASLLLAAVGSLRVAAGDPLAVPTVTERVDYWLDRLLRGPEEGTRPVGPYFDQDLLYDAERNLESTPDETLVRLADGALQARVRSSRDDANGWHAVLSVLVPIARLGPDVARAWAVPALRSGLLTLRRQAVPVFETLSSPEDGPTLLAALAADADDRLVGPACARILFRLSRPWDAAAVRVTLERGIADRSDEQGAAWLDLPAALAEVGGGARPDLLAWWALLADPVGPRAKPPRGRFLTSAPPTTASPEDASTTGAAAAALARAALARRGAATYVAAARADAAGSDPGLRAIAEDALAALAPPRDRAEVRRAAAAQLDALGGAAAPDPAAALGFVHALAADDDPAARALLERFLDELSATAAWRPALEAAYDALARRGADPGRVVREGLASGPLAALDRALAIAQHSRDATYLPLLEAALDRPEAASRRVTMRRLAVYLVTASLHHGGMDAEALSRWARHVAEWAADRGDVSAAGLLTSLVDLGPPGDAQFAQGLSGPDRDAYVAAIARPTSRYLPREVIEALLGPVGPDTAIGARRAALAAAFAVAGGDAVESLAALARRLRPEDRADVESVLRIVLHRPPAGG